MRKLKLILLILILSSFACKFSIPQIVNDPPKAQFSFGFKGRLEKLEDAFYQSNLKFTEFDYVSKLQTVPVYGLTLINGDTSLRYEFILQDCQSMHYLITLNDNWHCDSSYVHVEKYETNIDSLPERIAKLIFYEKVIRPLLNDFSKIPNDYHWEIKNENDTTYVQVLNQAKKLRKLYVYSFDSIGNSLAQKEIINYLGDSTIYYKKSPGQRYVYLESKNVLRHNSR